MKNKPRTTCFPSKAGSYVCSEISKSKRLSSISNTTCAFGDSACGGLRRSKPSGGWCVLLTICENWRGDGRQFFCLLINPAYQECFGTAYRFFIDSPPGATYFNRGENDYGVGSMVISISLPSRRMVRVSCSSTRS